jgi:hypothetical protein
LVFAATIIVWTQRRVDFLIAFGGYPTLFRGAAVIGIIGAVLVTRIKGVK